MIEAVRILAIAFVALVGAPAALACREVVPREASLAAYPTPVIATVTLAERVDSPGWNTWRISAVAAGDEPRASARATYDFLATLSSDGCGLTDLPPVGEKWVLYIAQSDPSDVEEAYPLAYVREYDARLENVH